MHLKTFFILLFIAAFLLSSYAQHYRGKVTDEKGIPLRNVNIYVPGAYNRGTVTSKDGDFQIEAKPHQTVNFQYTGKKEYSLYLNEKDTADIHVVMQPEITRLDEVTISRKLIIKEYVEDGYLYLDSRPLFQAVAADPQFPGGIDSLKSYLNHSLKYPEESFMNGEEGQVWIQFTVDSQGKVIQPIIKRSVSPALDAEAIRIIREMPAWKAGNTRGRAVNCQFLLPINFAIHKDYQLITED